MPSPNRLAVYVTAVVALAGALAPAVLDLGLPQVAAIIGSVATIGGVVAKWLTGWQQYERVLYQVELSTREHAAELEARAAVGKAGSRKSAITLPR